MTEPKILKFPSVVPDGTYRIRSAARQPRLYLQWELGNAVTPQPFNATNPRQLWKIFSQEDDIYLIQNVHSQQNLSVEWSEDASGVRTARLSSGALQYWCLDPRGDAFNVGMLENGMCVDLAGNNVAILWERNNYINQSWYLEIVDDNEEEQAGSGGGGGGGTGEGAVGTNPISSGVYNIVNRVTRADATIYTDANNATSTIKAWPALGATRTNNTRTWRITPDGVDGLKITYRNVPANSLRFLKAGPYISAGENVCRIIAVPGTPYFHIKLGTADNALCLQDHNNANTNNLTLSQAGYTQGDQRQQWQFVYVSP